MGKIDDMRRQREQQYAGGGKTSPAKSAAATAAPGDEQGKCPECGKTKPLTNGVLPSHQKGFGKACTGSRKKPV